MSRPKILHVGGTLYWVIRTRNPDTMVLKDADSTPTVAVRKNGASTADSVTVTKRSATTGIYDCSYNPAGEAEGDEFTIEESATVTGTTTAQATYTNSWEFAVLALERGTDGANTTTPPATAAIRADIESSTVLAKEATVADGVSDILSAVGNIEVDNAAIADAVWNKDISGAAGSTAGAYLKDIWGRITAAVYQIFQDLSTMITGSGTADAQWTVNALENNPSGSVIVYPTQLQAEDRNVEGPIKIYTGESGEQFFHAIDADQNPIDLTGITLELRFGDSTSKNILYTAKTSDNTIVVSDTNKVTFTKSVNFTRFELSTLVYSLRNMDEGSEVILRGPVKLIWAP